MSLTWKNGCSRNKRTAFSQGVIMYGYAALHERMVVQEGRRRLEHARSGNMGTSWRLLLLASRNTRSRGYQLKEEIFDWFTYITDIGGRRGLRLAGSITSMVVQGERRAQHAGHRIWRTSGLNWNHLFSRFQRVPIINWRMLHMKGWLLKKKEENCNTLALEMRGHHDDLFYRRPSKQVTSILLIAEIYSTTSILLTSHTWLLHKLPISQSRKDDFSRKKKRLQQTGHGNVWSSRRLLL